VLRFGDGALRTHNLTTGLDINGLHAVVYKPWIQAVQRAEPLQAPGGPKTVHKNKQKTAGLYV